MHCELQPSPEFIFPSSHCSLGSRTPFPQFLGDGLEEDEELEMEEGQLMEQMGHPPYCSVQMTEHPGGGRGGGRQMEELEEEEME